MKEKDELRRLAHRGMFCILIFIFPVAMLGFGNLTLLCSGWLISYVICAFVNRAVKGPGVNDSRRAWLKINNNNFISDLFKFRSEFSINSPGGHREGLEKFYPYFNVICAVFVLASLMSNRSSQPLSLDEAISTVDGSSFLGTVNLKNEIKSKNLEIDNVADNGSGDRKPGDVGREAIPVPIFKPTMARLDKRNIAGRLDPNLDQKSEGDEMRILDLLNTRNMVFLLLFMASIWILNRNGANSSYGDKWKQHMAEVREIQKEGRSAVADVLKLQFAASLIVTEMWGHRSFREIFYEIITEFKARNQSCDTWDSEKLLAEINTEITDKIC